MEMSHFLFQHNILSIVPEKKNNLDKADAIYHTLVLGLNTPAGARAICDLANPYVHRLFILSRTSKLPFSYPVQTSKLHPVHS